MQAAMWVILAATLGLAQLVSYQRQNAPVVLDSPVPLGPVMVAPPEGWTVAPDSDSDGNAIAYESPQDERILQFSVSRGSPASAAESGADRDAQTISFQGLHREGTIRPVREVVRLPDGSAVRAESLLATTTLASGVEVSIELVINGTRTGPADRRLVQAVANGITPAGQGDARRPRTIRTAPKKSPAPDDDQ